MIAITRTAQATKTRALHRQGWAGEVESCAAWSVSLAETNNRSRCAGRPVPFRNQTRQRLAALNESGGHGSRSRREYADLGHFGDANWIVYRGPDDATFDPAGFQRSMVEEKAEESSTSTSVVATTADTADPTEVATSLAGDGWTSATFDATVTFDEPGMYTLKAVACDAMMMTHAEVVVTVSDVSGWP